MTALLFPDDNETSTVTGYVAATGNSTFQSPALSDYSTSIISGNFVNLAALPIVSFNLDATVQETFFDDWYNRIHIIPRQIDLNNVITDQTRQIELWNAYLDEKLLSNTVFPPTQGLTVTSPVSTPYSIRPLETLMYTVSVSSDGPPVINVILEWVIEGEVDIQVPVTGRRIIVWPFAPNWSVDYVESLDWLTDVMTSYYGYEQRVEIRAKPRRMFEYTSLLEKIDSNVAANLLWGWQNRNFALPVWIDLTTLNTSVFIGDITLSLDTTSRGFFSGGLLILINGSMDYEVVEIESFSASSVTLAKPLERDWSAGSKVYPVNISSMPQSVQSRKLTDSVTEISTTFSAEPVQTDPYIPVISAPITYNGYEVVLRKPNWAVPIQFDNQYDYEMIDFQTGGFRTNPTTVFPRINRRFQWILKNRSEIVDFRGLLGRLKGRLKPVYLPTWIDDFTLYLSETASSVSIRVNSNEFHKMVGSDPALKTLMILPKSGAPIIRLIESVGLDPLGFTTLGLNAAIGIDLNSSTLSRLSLVHLCRLTTDRVTINYESSSVATVEANFTLVTE